MDKRQGGHQCMSCMHYSFYLMITGGPYGYSGPIPCSSCDHFRWTNDNYVPAGSKAARILSDIPQKEFEAVALPVVEWICNNCHPRVCVVIDSTSAALYEGQLAVSTDKFLRD